MKAMILAAGLGTRLKPLTDNKPKALVEINGVPMLGLLIEKLKRYGCDNIVVNIHHFGQQIIDYPSQNNNFNISIAVSDERFILLDTGGGIKHARKLLPESEAFIVHNVDIYSDIDIAAMYRYHLSSGNLVTLAVKQRESSNYLYFDSNNLLCGWKSYKTGREIISRPIEQYKELAFSGIHIINPSIFDMITEEGCFGIVPVYLRLAATHSIGAYLHQGDTIIDLGKTESLLEVERAILQKNDDLQ